MSHDEFPSAAMVGSLEGRMQNFDRLNRELLVLFERLAAKGDERFLQLLKGLARQGS